MNILIVDDSDQVRDFLKEALRGAGREVLEASDGAKAWAMYDQKPVPVVLCDWEMPGMDGLALCRKIRERPKTAYTYFILVTGKKLGFENYHTAMEAGADDFLTKPVDLDALFIRLKVAERIVNLNARVRQLEGFIPVCMYCKRIRRDDQAYEKMEDYIEQHSLAVFSHGICPDCLAKKMADVEA